ncbi:hypothetical protein KDL01_01070 [Actinospica durhamensis]|uniref:Uncharacterized protein n=1 Tax=Actinospica durhamensis TaxID=1508375 RepID=A0A941EQD4_9ACTN|nr:hypothetical protein [Actinospica durhamensis]MBR7831829.1 hypothetical protein [Actinospica durhamensis]
MGNLDFNNHAGFSWYCILLAVSGVLLLGLSVLPGLNVAGRVLNLLFGLGFLGYGCYLIFLFHGGQYLVFFQAFIVPVLLLINSIRGVRSANLHRRARSRQKKRAVTYERDLVREQAAVQAALAQAHAAHSMASQAQPAVSADGQSADA